MLVGFLKCNPKNVFDSLHKQSADLERCINEAFLYGEQGSYEQLKTMDKKFEEIVRWQSCIFVPVIVSSPVLSLFGLSAVKWTFAENIVMGRGELGWEPMKEFE